MTLELAPDITVTDTEHGAVLLDGRSGRYWQLNTTGVYALRCLTGGGTVEGAISALCDRFPQAADQIATDLDVLIGQLLAAKLVTS